METRVEIAFSLEPLQHHREVLCLTPILGGTPLTELVLSFEQDRGFEPAGRYGGLVPDFFNYGSLEQYFMGKSVNEYFKDRCYLLGCGDCGEVGCWPLWGRIKKTGNLIVWDSFSQEHRPLRDYSDFGPFIFELEPYRKRVLDVAAHF